MKDFYLENRTRLQGQPKKTIADYVEKNGILVPKRFSTLVEARSSGVPVLSRSEHAQEYDGVSGLLKSHDLDEFPKSMNEEELWKEFTKEKENNVSFPSVYCTYKGMSLENFWENVSFSYWEKIGGANRTVVADSAIKGRYHIATNKDHGELINYTIFENGGIFKQSRCQELTPEFVEGLPRLIEIYENVRNLANFDGNHCPMMEFQTDNEKDYFLQYHRTRDFDPSTFNLDRNPEEGENEVFLVRGATPKEGLSVRATLAYASWFSMKNYEDWTTPKEEEASFDMHYNFVFCEIMSRLRKVQIIKSPSADFALEEVAIEHMNRSHLFKPKVSIVVGDRLCYDNEFSKLSKLARETGEDQHINLQVISDGRKAYVKRV